jgi:hypothetical protein
LLAGFLYRERPENVLLAAAPCLIVGIPAFARETEVWASRQSTNFGADVDQAEESVAAVMAIVAVGTAADLALDDVTANVAFGTIDVERYVQSV